MTPQRLPMHVMKGKRKRANLSNEKAPSISKALFDDQSPIPTRFSFWFISFHFLSFPLLYLSFPLDSFLSYWVSSFANLNLRENGTYNQATSPSLTQGTSPSFLSGSTQDSATWLKPTSFQFANFATKELPPSAYKATNGLSFISPNTQMPSYSPSNIPIKTSNKNTQKLKPVNPIAFDSPGLTPIGKPHGLSPIQSNMKSNPIQSNPFEMPTTSIPESSIYLYIFVIILMIAFIF